MPRLEAAKNSPDANAYSLLLMALLERGEPITLEEAAARFEAAGIAPAGQALASLKRCRPARPPIYRDGDRYALDPHDEEADLWAFRLGLRPPKAAALRLVRPDLGPLPDVGILVVVFGPLDAFFQTEEVSAGVVSLLAALGLLLIGGGIIIEAGVEVKR